MAEDEEPGTGQDDRGRPSASPPSESAPDGAPLEWSEEERRLLAELEGSREADTTEAMRRLVLGILREARSAAADARDPGGSDPTDR